MGSQELPAQSVNTLAPSQEQHRSLWNSFEHILMFISLLVMAVSSTLLLHAFVDKWLPGEGAGIASDTYFLKSFVRVNMSALIVSYPLFAFFFLHTKARMHRFPELFNSTARKVLIYATLVITFVIMLINVIVAIFSFLNGNISTNLFLHIGVTIAVSAIIFGYYFSDVKYGIE